MVAWGYATTVASLALALLMPFLGSLADLKGNKKKFLAGTIGTGAVSLAVMGVPGNAMVFLAIYVFSSVMLNASLVFYLSLIHISEPTRQAEISYAVFCLTKKRSTFTVKLNSFEALWQRK